MSIYGIANQSWSPASRLPDSPLIINATDVIGRWIVVTITNIGEICSCTCIYDVHTQQWTQVNTAV